MRRDASPLAERAASFTFGAEREPSFTLGTAGGWLAVERYPVSAVCVDVAMSELLYEREVFMNFPTSRQWVSIKLFALPPEADDYTVLRLLIDHVRYRASHACTGDRDMETVHGPYWLYAIAWEIFSPVAVALVVASDDYGPASFATYARTAARCSGV